MGESFNNRVDKIFGSLGKSSSSLHSLWSLKDEEVEKREWNRERGEIDREENPCSSSFDGFFARERRKSERKPRNFRKELEDDLEDLTDGDDERNEPVFNRSEDERDEWDIRSSIGLDCTLDNEEEEDEYDKVAVGRDGADDRMYMRNVTDYGTHLNSYNVIPDSFKDLTRDPRANHLAARIRLKEDGKEAGSFVSVSTSDDKMTGVESQVTEDGSSLKSILKRKVEHDDAKAQKRVRFDSGCKDVCEDKVEEETQDSPMATCPIEPATVAENPPSVSQDAGVPDYIRNPSKYTRYSFDSTTDINDSSNRQACMDFLNMMRRSKAVDVEPETTAADMPGSVTFIPRKKAGDIIAATKKCDKVNQNQEDDASKEFMHRTSLQLGIAAREADENDVCAMEEDDLQVETESKSIKSQRPGRQYRAKVT